MVMTACAGGSGGEERCGFVLVPGVGTLFFEEVDDALVDGGFVEGLAAFVAEEDGDGNAPDALAGDAPVGPGGDHVGDSLFAPCGIPDDFLDLVEGALAEGAGSRE